MPILSNSKNRPVRTTPQIKTAQGPFELQPQLELQTPPNIKNMFSIGPNFQPKINIIKTPSLPISASLNENPKAGFTALRAQDSIAEQ